MNISQKYRLPFMATTPTRRANRERVLHAGYNEEIILDNIKFLDKIRNSSHMKMYIGGLMGCRGNAYTGADALSMEDAYDFHCWQTQLFKRGKVDFLYAGIMPVLTEAAGIARAMSYTDNTQWKKLPKLFRNYNSTSVNKVNTIFSAATT